MKSIFTIFSFLFVVEAYSQNNSCPTTIKVGQNCSCHSCTSSIDVYPFNYYVANVLTGEWGQWGSWTGGMNSLNAGAVAIRSYALNRIIYPYPSHGSSYNICNNTCCHVYNTSLIPTSYASNAVINTANYILVNSSGNVGLAEYAAETNDASNYTVCSYPFLGACGDGYFQKSFYGPGLPNPHNCSHGGGCYPLTGQDPLCKGKLMSGQPRGMCQRGTARWATGYTVPSNSNIGTLNGYTTKNWQQLIAYYYPYWSLTTCTPIVTSNNDNPCIPLTLNVNSTCVYTNTSNNSATYSLGVPNPTCVSSSSNTIKDVWFRFTVPSSGNFTIQTIAGTLTDAVMAIYVGSCNSLTQAQCNDDYSGNLMPKIVGTRTPGYWIYVRVWGYNGATGTFSICVRNGSFPRISNNNPEPITGNLTISPNPATSVSTISYFIRQESKVSLRLYDMSGRELSRILDDQQDEGIHNVSFDFGVLPKGIYICQLLCNNIICENYKLIILK